MNKDLMLFLCWDLKMFCVQTVIISSLQWSANIHLATGQLVDMLHYQHAKKKISGHQ